MDLQRILLVHFWIERFLLLQHLFTGSKPRVLENAVLGQRMEENIINAL